MKNFVKSKIFFFTVFGLFCIIILFFFLMLWHQKNIKSATDFYVGADISSLMEVEENGGIFYDENDNPSDALKLLKENGMDSIRLRIWNDPVDKNGNPYANGHNDLETAIYLGKRASKLGMRVLIDFHYSDYWADPSNQIVPKAWKNLTFSEKESALYDYTISSLKALLDAGVNVTMVQIGNETTSGFCGETSWDKMTALMSQGSKAVRDISTEYDREILVALHFTEYKDYDWYASQLQTYHVDYDVFASSYYPFWHGDLDGLEKSLQNIINKYGKKVLIAEFSYPYTFADSDEYSNNISLGSSYDFIYKVNKDGQQEAIKDIYKTATSLGDDCLGLFYWEPLWISVKDSDIFGSPWDNQTLFDKDGKPLPSLRSFLFSEDH